MTDSGNAAPIISSFTPASGSVGTLMTINGQNFSGNAGLIKVSIGGRPASKISIKSTTEITATVGGGSTGTITVTTPGGTAISSNTFVYYNDYIYGLLPAIYRVRDVEQGEPLRALLSIIDEQVQALKDDIDGLYKDWFIETCNDWIVPYIGDMVGNRPLHDITQLRRTDVAKTIYYRRRKGTAAMLEEMARDITGWGAHVVEFFQLLGWTQNLNHQRYSIAENPRGKESLPAVDRVGTINLRSTDVLDRLNGPFDIISHTVDIRPVSNHKGWYNIRKIGFFLWRLNYYLLKKSIPRAVPGKDGFFTFNRLGNMSLLFNKPQREDEDTRLASETQVPGPIRPMAFAADLDACRSQSSPGVKTSDYFGPDRSIDISVNDVPVPPQDIVGMDLSSFEYPDAGKIGIDVKNGLIGFAKDKAPSGEALSKFSVSYTYGFSADIGGGPYERRQDMIETGRDITILEVGKGETYNTIQEALTQWANSSNKPCVIRICDNGVYEVQEEDLDISFPDKGWLMLQADSKTWPDIRLLRKPPDTGPGSLSCHVGSAKTATLILDGLLIEGSLKLSGGLDVTLQHCTLVPGLTLKITGEAYDPDSSSIGVVNGSADLSVAIKKSIVGAIRMPAGSKCLSITDSIVQSPLLKNGTEGYAIVANSAGTIPGPPMYVERSTIFGHVFAKELVIASETIFTGQVTIQRQQKGCVRFSYIPPDSITPRRYHCQSGLELKPQFTSICYGKPGYAQLGPGCAEEIYAGAADGSEMGVYCFLKQQQREANLNIRLQEYLPFGLEPGFIHVT